MKIHIECENQDYELPSDYIKELIADENQVFSVEFFTLDRFFDFLRKNGLSDFRFVLKGRTATLLVPSKDRLF